MIGIKKKFGPLANIEFDKLFFGQVFSHFSDAIIQFLLVAILIQMSGSAGKSIAIMFFVFFIGLFNINKIIKDLAHFEKGISKPD